VFEKDCVAHSCVMSVGDIDLVAPIMIPSVANVETTGSVGSPRFSYCWDKMCFDLASKWCKWVDVIIMLFSQIFICGYCGHHLRWS
jgi:hypothetical protein